MNYEGAAAGQSRPLHADGLDGTLPLRPGIQQAVNSAVDHSHPDLDPHLVSKITEHVVTALKKEMLGSSVNATTAPIAMPSSPTNAPLRPVRTHSSGSVASETSPMYSIPSNFNRLPQGSPPRSTVRQAAPQSPSSQGSSHAPPQYTPPSPHYQDNASRGSISPEPLFADTASNTSKDARNGRRDSKASLSGQEDVTSSRQRARPVRVPSSVEETSLEKAWQPLFVNGSPTHRLGQFLRGLAKHIIEDCKPQNSIVVTPGKLADFFQMTEVPSEMHPWTAVFGGKLTNNAISRLFSHLRCQHHLIQFGDQDTPTIPGLTPLGFQSFMTILIQAYPDQEYQRLGKALKNLPISNADDPSERFPKELTRRLLPATGDITSAHRLSSAVSLDPALRAHYTSPLSPPLSAQLPKPGVSAAFAERTRNPYSNTFSSAIDDEDLRSTSVPIERERKPYTAREGGGKVHEGSRVPIEEPRVEGAFRSTRAYTASGTSPPQIPIQLGTRPINVSNATPRTHRMSVNGPPTAKYMGQASQPLANPYTRSEGVNIASIPQPYYPTRRGDNDDQVRGTRQPFRQTPEDAAPRGTSAASRSGAVPTPISTGNGSYGSRTHPSADIYGSSLPGPPPYAPRS